MRKGGVVFGETTLQRARAGSYDRRGERQIRRRVIKD
jgi:hypothetical protein